MKHFVKSLSSLKDNLSEKIQIVGPLFDLLARIYVARVFLLSGWSKISDWSSTIYLFTDEYHVPLLPPVIAAISGTFGELVFGTLVLLGAFTQLSALGLFMVNLMAVISYYSELVSTPAAIHDHIEWGLILALLMISRSHRWGIDGLIGSK